MVNTRLGAVVIRIRRYAPMWPAHGPMLLAGAMSAVRLLGRGDRDSLIELAEAIAGRLFVVSARTSRPRPPGRRKRASVWNDGGRRRNPPGAGERRDSRHHGQRHEKDYPVD